MKLKPTLLSALSNLWHPADPWGKASLILGGILSLAAASSPAATPPSYDFTMGAPAGPGLQNPQAVAVDSGGNVYVVDTGNQRIVKFSRTGSFLLAWGETGDTPGKFSNPSSIAIDSTSNVYVLDSVNESIQKFSSSGAFLTRWYCPHPTAVAIDRDDYVYVADRGAESRVFNHWGGGWVVEYVPGVRKFTGDGRLLRQWPLNTTPFYQYTGLGYSGTYYTAGLAVGRNGDIFVGYSYRYTNPFGPGEEAIWEGAGIEWFASDGVYALDLGAMAVPDALAVDSANNIYATERLNHRINLFTFEADGSVAVWRIPGSGASSLAGPRGVAVDRSDNYVIVADTGHNRALVFAHQPTLNIRSTAANSVVLSWSAAVTGYRLQQKPAPGASDWVNVTNPPTLTGDQFTVTNSMSSPAQFFRLAKP